MADITEVIHKITYEVNDEALKRTIKALDEQYQAIVKLLESSRALDKANGTVNEKSEASFIKQRKLVNDLKDALDKLKKAQEALAKGEGSDEKVSFRRKAEKWFFGKTADIIEDDKRKKAEWKKGIEYYEQVTGTGVKALVGLYDTKVKAIDMDIAKQKEAVETAKKLAAQGNTEALRLEEEKLNELTKKRERYVRTQLILNAALAASNAVAAVAKTAVETGPLAPAIIPLVVAALIAGYGVVTAATKNAQSFADGVIDFKGMGGPRDDANWVRISSGESVITADGTRKNHALLEAINKGANFQFINPALVNALPMLKQPEISSANNYASAKELKSLEKKLDEVVYAIEGNKLRQNIFFNEQGVGIMTEKAVNRNKKRWS